MALRETSQDIDIAAAQWAAQIDRGLSAEEQGQLDAWVSADVRRQGALARALAVLEHFDGPQIEAATHSERPWGGLGRRNFLAGGALAAGLGVAGVLLTGQLGRGREYTTAKGELRSIPLEDGSTMLLNTASRARVHFSPGRRDVTLLSGEALFDVAKDPARPFVVRSQALDVRAVGTSFSVSRLPGRPLQVLVREGFVDVNGTAAQAPPTTHLMAGCWATASEAGDVDVRHVGVPTVLRALAWRDGKLDLDGMTLAYAAQTFSRYSDQKIVIDSPAAGRLTVSGVFAARDPAAFARAAAEQLNLKVRQEGRVIHLAT